MEGKDPVGLSLFNNNNSLFELGFVKNVYYLPPNVGTLPASFTLVQDSSGHYTMNPSTTTELSVVETVKLSYLRCPLLIINQGA